MAMNEANIYALAEKEAMEQLKARYERDGFTVIPDYRVGNVIFDLYAEKGDLKFAFEFKTRAGMQNIDLLENYREIAKSLGIHYRVVIVQPPVEKRLEVEGLEATLEENFRMSIPDDLDALSTHTMIEEVDDVSFSKTEQRLDGSLYIEGKAEVLIELNYGSLKDDVSHYYTVPFKFKGTWVYTDGNNVRLVSLQECIFDTSDFYE